MKTALAFVCSLMLAWTNIVLAQAPAASVATATASCHCGKKSDCCAAKRSLPEPSPVSTAPTSSLQNQISFLAPVVATWFLPESPVREFPSSVSPSFANNNAPLFERNCAWVI
jgi:hypothetical protein